MRPSRATPWSAVCIVALISCLPLPRRAFGPGDPPPDPVGVVERFIGVFNAFDVGAMASMVADDIELYSADEHGRFSLASGTAHQLVEDLRE